MTHKKQDVNTKTKINLGKKFTAVGFTDNEANEWIEAKEFVVARRKNFYYLFPLFNKSH